MESPNDKLQKMSGAIIKKRGQNADLLRKQFLASLDLNQPVEIESQDQYNYEVEPTPVETQKRRVNDSMVNENINLTRKLSSESSSNNLHDTMESKDLPTQILGFELGGTFEQDPPTRCVKGCKLCMMFVIVSKNNPNCPRCKACLIDVDNV
ncbi:hypothetical protein MtrunA17_Chr1g0206901 [Medicago truncatula]|uniref:Uncharacterized protein n=1 Tax=Medicago truncatula TaxID=3880 RepID=A0A396K2V0_MEDTR|nr:hypothetical protein MtrunA17_Chr1g0206901 [Medicago truncatula]